MHQQRPNGATGRKQISSTTMSECSRVPATMWGRTGSVRRGGVPYSHVCLRHRRTNCPASETRSTAPNGENHAQLDGSTRSQVVFGRLPKMALLVVTSREKLLR